MGENWARKKVMPPLVGLISILSLPLCLLFLSPTYYVVSGRRGNKQPGKMKLEELPTQPNVLQQVCRDKPLLMHWLVMKERQ